MSIEALSFLKKLYVTFWFASLVLFLCGIPFYNLLPPDNNFSINVYDTYYAMDIFEFTTFLALFYFLLGFGYWLVKKVKGRLNKTLSLVHALIMFGSLISYGIAVLLNSSSTDRILIISLIAVIFIAQPIYVINLMIGIFNWKKDRKVSL